MALLERLNNEIKKKRPHLKKKKCCFIKTMHRVTNQSKRRQNCPSDFLLFADLKRMLAGKNFCTNEEVITENRAYFENMSKSKKK
jgi:hypothetical protein